MNRTWLTVINEIVNSKENELSVEVTHKGKSIRLKVGNYNRCMRDYPHINIIRTLMNNIKSTLGYDVTEVIKNDNTTYIINLVIPTVCKTYKYIIVMIYINDIYNLLHNLTTIRDIMLKQNHYWEVISKNKINLKSMNKIKFKCLQNCDTHFRIKSNN